jgi:indole-3-glycerol phosphate synthase
VLRRIVAAKLAEVAEARRRSPLTDTMQAALSAPPPKDLMAALGCPQAGAPLACIAEIKRASPSRGIIRHDFDPVQIAIRYRSCGASAISVVTDMAFFGGHLDHLRAVRQVVDLPLLRKDFTLEEYQVYEARAAGADAVLLIVAAVPDAGRLQALRELAEGLGMAALVEVHSTAELRVALRSGARLIGINNRDLRTFRTSLEVFLRLAPQVPPGVTLVAESGISTTEQCRMLAQAGAKAVLVGEALMRHQDPGRALATLLGLEGHVVD